MEASEDARRVYGDILFHPHHRSETHPPMPLRDRAAQFSAYDALAGYYDMIAEEERITEAETELDENARELLNQKLLLIADAAEEGQRPMISFVRFVPDGRKAGGSYESISERVRQIDLLKRCVVLERKEGRAGRYAEIGFDEIRGIHGTLVDSLDTLT